MRGRKKSPRPYTKERLESAALYYLERYASSIENLKRVLMRKVQRGLGPSPDSEKIAEAQIWIEAIATKFESQGILNDSRYAEAVTRREHNRGRGINRIRQTLTAKGLGQEQTQSVLEALRADEGDADLKAAVIYARRKKIGPFRTKTIADPVTQRQKDLASLARQGIALSAARLVLDAESVSEALKLMET